MTIGIYKITNTVNGKVYIGKSHNIEERFKQHIEGLNGKRNHNPHFQSAWNKYGKSNFKFEIIHHLKRYVEEEISDLEIYYISKYNSADANYGYNFQCGGQGGKLSERHKEIMKQQSQFKNASLTYEEVVQIKLALYCLIDKRELSEIFNVDIGVIKSISEARNYYYVCEELNDKIKGLKQKLIDERNEEVIKLYNEGFRIVDIIEELDLSKSMVEHIIYDRNLHLKRKTEKEKKYKDIYNEVIKLYNEGFIPHHISKELNIPSTTVYRYIKKYKNQQANIEVS